MRPNLTALICSVIACAMIATAPLAVAQTRDPTGAPTGSPADRGSPRDDGGTAAERRPARNADAARARGNRFEFVTSGPLNQAGAAQAVLTQAGAVVIRSRRFENLRRHVLVLDLQRLSPDDALTLLANAAPQTRLDLHHFYRYAQGKPRLYAPQMLGVSAPSRCRLNGLRVGVIDGPVDASHPALAPARLTRHSVLLQGERADRPTHGTGVAALIAGEDASGALAGFSPGARLYTVNAFAKEKRGAAADVERLAAALDWLIGQRVRLVNMSFAAPPNVAFADVLQAAAARGTVMVAAAGNRGDNVALYPAAASEVIAVTAVDAAGRRYRKASRGGHIEFAAPGVDLYIAKGNRGSYASGTSYAAPIVTALAAQAMARGTSGANGLRRALRRGLRDLGDPGRDVQFGWGLVQAPGC